MKKDKHMRKLILACCIFLVLIISSNWIVDAQNDKSFIRGDINSDERVNVNDAVALLNYLFSDGKISCLDAADVDDSGIIDINDAIYLLHYLFFREFAIPEPNSLGHDSTQDELIC